MSNGHKIELLFNSQDGSTFVNFWDFAHGNDVVAVLKDNKLIYTDDNTNIESEITFQEFVDKVKESINKRNL